ncbi:MHYT domain-containing protein [Amycolatopsis alkalitolerans]|uniref:Signal protein n=1 Tax=Amycolatopsis alkalitolerans TaxID=2547244 RepID=A0A5C4MCP9_9PSEU|nr:MHYT domain-containing protein [Amycolatopsis alkalitolerans]TNC29781.1 signal protein [Amycolatopsis alkalitolerans]
MNQVEHFALGGWLVVLAYLTSAVGCTLGLACTLHARHAADTRSRLGWLGLASLSLGGVGIWLMHFVAMLGFETPGLPVRYDVRWTVLSAVLAVAAAFGGLLLFGVGARFSWWRLFASGLVTGGAVNLMHYTGMWALEIKGTIGYDAGLVALSVAIAVVAATAALWFTVAADKPLHRLAAGLVAGVAVTGMHYTGMAAMRVHLDISAPDPSGVEVFSFLFPVFVLAAVALAVPICAVLLAPAPGRRPRDERVAVPQG